MMFNLYQVISDIVLVAIIIFIYLIGFYMFSSKPITLNTYNSHLICERDNVGYFIKEYYVKSNIVYTDNLGKFNKDNCNETKHFR